MCIGFSLRQFFRGLKPCLVLCLLASVHPTHAQQVQRQAWTTEEGLPQNSVHAMLQTDDGYLWLATENGVARFNGLRFRRFYQGNEAAFTSDDVCCVVQPRPGLLLFGTANGVVAAQNDRFYRIGKIDGDVIAMQVETGGTTLVLNDAGLYRVSEDSATPVVLAGATAATALGSGQNGTTLAAAGTLLFRIANGRAERLGELPAVPMQVAETAPGEIWIAYAGGVMLLDARLQKLHEWRADQNLPGSRVESLQRWPGGVLVGTSRGAVVLRAAAQPSPVPQLDGNAVLCALTDREGDAWFGTDSGGLVVLRERVITTASALAGESVTALAAAPDGSLLIGTRDAGLQRLRAERVTKVAGKLASQVVLALGAGAQNDVWAGSPEGLDHLVASRVQHWTAADGLPDDFVRALLVSPDTVWVGTRRGVAAVRNGHVERVLTVANGLASDVIGAMLRDRSGAVWIGTVAGLALWDGSTLHPMQAPSTPRLAVASLAQSKDETVWVGTDKGLFRVRDGVLVPAGGTALRSSVVALLIDRFGFLWARTPEGIVRVRIADLQTCGDSTCSVNERLFGVADGMPSVELPALGSPLATQTPDGALWFATRRGAARILPHAETAVPPAPGIAIEEALVDERPEPFRPELNVSAGARRVAIAFAGLSLHAPSQVQYRYLLDGFDKDWSPWDGGNVADYTNLPSGRYALRVQARTVEGVVSRQDATVVLQVHAPIYRRWWFYLGLLLLAGAAATAWYRLRLLRIRRGYEAVLQERNRIAREIHDTLAQDFVAVSLQLEVTSQLLQLGATEAAHQQIDTTRTLVRDGIQDARESIWALRAGGTAETLPARLAAAVKPVAHASLLVTGAYRSLPPSREREIFRIAKEALGNAARHAKANRIQVELIYLEDAVVLRVSDDGAGFDTAAARKLAGHYGVRGMGERAAAMGAALTVQSSPGNGSCVELRLSVRG